MPEFCFSDYPQSLSLSISVKRSLYCMTMMVKMTASYLFSVPDASCQGRLTTHNLTRDKMQGLHNQSEFPC